MMLCKKRRTRSPPPISAGKPASSDAINNNYPSCQSIGADNPRGLTGRNTKRKSCAKETVKLDCAYEDKVLDEL